MLATDLLRERVAHFMPDSRLTRTELEREYAGLGGNASVDFSDLATDDDAGFAERCDRLGAPSVTWYRRHRHGARGDAADSGACG